MVPGAGAEAGALAAWFQALPASLYSLADSTAMAAESAPRPDYFFTSGHVDADRGWNALSPGTTATWR
jgi:hypothetical protein